MTGNTILLLDKNTKICKKEYTFLRDVWPGVRYYAEEYYGPDDTVALREEFSNWLDGLYKDGIISQHTVDNITIADLEATAI